MLLLGGGGCILLLLYPHVADAVRPIESEQVDNTLVVNNPPDIIDAIGKYSSSPSESKTKSTALRVEAGGVSAEVPDWKDVDSLTNFVMWYGRWSCFQLTVVVLFAWLRSRPTIPHAQTQPSPDASNTAEPVEEAHWHDDWWSCSDPKSIGMGFFCPCVLWADNMYLAGLGTRWSFDVFVCLVLYFSHLLFPAPIMWLAMIVVMMMLLARTRRWIGQKSGMKIDSCQALMDFALVLLCYPLTLAQESRHLQHALLIGHPAFVRGKDELVEEAPNESVEGKADTETAKAEEGQVVTKHKEALPPHRLDKLRGTERKAHLLKRFQDAASKSLEKYSVYLDQSMYDAVVVACFGGVGIERAGRDHYLLRPHHLLLCGCLPLFAFQNTLLWCMVIDSEFTSPIDDRMDRHLRLLHVAKLLMVAQLAMMALLEMSRSLQAIFFVINPATGIEFVRHVEEPEKGEGGCLWRFWMSGPFGWSWCCISATLAEGMQLHVAYNVLLLSLSTVLQQQRVHDVMFNGLALLFVLDLDNVWFAFLAKFIAIDPSRYETATDDAFFLIATPWIENGVHRWLSWSSKAGARMASQFITVLALLFIAQRQLMDYYIAVKTNKLPVWRYVCDLYTGYLWADLPSFIREQAVLYSTPTFLRLRELITEDVEYSIRNATNGTNKSNSTAINGSLVLPGPAFNCYPDFSKETDAVTTWPGLLHNALIYAFNRTQYATPEDRPSTDLAVATGNGVVFIDVGFVVNGLVMVLSMLLMGGSVRSIYK